MTLTRRKLLTSAAAFGMAAAFAPAVRADDENDSIWDILQHNARMKSVDPDKNTTAALATIDTPVIRLTSTAARAAFLDQGIARLASSRIDRP